MIVWSATVWTVIRAQSPAPEFEVASVKADNRTGVRPTRTYTSGGFTAVHLFPRQFIAEAYDVPRELVSGGPGWIDSEAFDIEGNTSGPAEQVQVRRMLQSLLADRFKLKIRHETKELPISYMTLPKPSPKLVPAKEGEPKGEFTWGSQFVKMPNVSMANLAGVLRRAVGHTVIDKTGIEGGFTIFVETTPEDPFRNVDDALLAVVRDLGLKLETAKGLQDTITVEGIEHPSAN